MNFDEKIKNWLIDNGYINEGWRFKVVTKEIIGRSDVAEVFCKAYKPRKRKPFYISFNVNYVREIVYTDTIKVAD